MVPEATAASSPRRKRRIGKTDPAVASPPQKHAKRDGEHEQSGAIVPRESEPIDLISGAGQGHVVTHVQAAANGGQSQGQDHVVTYGQAAQGARWMVNEPLPAQHPGPAWISADQTIDMNLHWQSVLRERDSEGFDVTYDEMYKQLVRGASLTGG